MSEIVNSVDYYYISVLNNGGYIAQFKFSYNFNGQHVEINVSDTTLGFTQVMKFPKGATDVYIEVHAFLFGVAPLIFWDVVNSNKNTCYVVYGPIWGPKYYERNCDSLEEKNIVEVGPVVNPSSIPCSCCCICNNCCCSRLNCNEKC